MGKDIAVIVVAHNEERYIGECIESILRQSVPPREIIIVDGCSSDRTSEICLKLAKSNLVIRYIRNDDPHQTITKNRNIGLRSTTAVHIAFTDADCRVPEDWLEILWNSLVANHEKKLAGVGGTNIAPPEASSFTKAVAVVQSSRLGFIGSAQGQSFGDQCEVKSLSCTNALLERLALEDVGFFNEELGNIGEDYELGFRLQRKGYQLLFIPTSFVWHHLRNSPLKFAQNMFAYGLGRARLMSRLKEYSVKYLLPMPFLITIALSALLVPVFPILIIVPSAYVLIVLLYSFTLVGKAKTTVGDIFLAFLCLHFSYPAGQLTAVFRHRTPRLHKTS